MNQTGHSLWDPVLGFLGEYSAVARPGLRQGAKVQPLGPWGQVVQWFFGTSCHKLFLDHQTTIFEVIGLLSSSM